MSTEITVPQESELSSQQSPVAWAIANNVSPEQMLQYYQLDREMKADIARNAFNKSFAAFKTEAVSIIKNTSVTDGPLKGKSYANLFDVVNAVTPALARHGLSHSWRLSKDEPTWMEITCTIRHELGHSESVSMGSAPDTGPGRNAIQARGSAKSYLERYTLLAATGMAASDVDDDGNGGEKVRMPESDFISWEDSIKSAYDVDELRKNFGQAAEAADEAGDVVSKDLFIRAKNKRYKELAPPKGASK